MPGVLGDHLTLLALQATHGYRVVVHSTSKVAPYSQDLLAGSQRQHA